MTLDLLTASGLTAAFSFLLSVLFVLIPPLRAWFVARDAETQQAVTGIAIIAIAVIAVVGGCLGWFPFIPCTTASIGQYVIGVVFAAILGDRTSKGVFAAARYFSRTGDARGLSLGGRGKLLG